LSGDIGLNQTRKELVVVLLMLTIVPISLVFWLQDPAAYAVIIPTDVRVKLDRNLEEAIESHSWNDLHDCGVYLRLTGNITEDMQTVLDIVPSNLIQGITESQAMFQALLNAERIFDLARMNEVRKIELTQYVYAIGSID
jgi:hypothetical protein